MDWFQFCDNDGACKLSESNISSRRMQHVASRLAYLQENVDDLIIALFHFISKGNIADIGLYIPTCITMLSRPTHGLSRAHRSHKMSF